MKILPTIFFILAVMLVLLFFVSYLLLYRQKSPVADMAEGETAALSHPRRRFPMEIKDLLPLFVITALYAAVAFTGLGDKQAPESFCSFSERGRYVIIELPSETPISRISYYSGLHTGRYYLQYSLDGENYTDEAVMEQKYSDLFKWHDATLSEIGKGTKYIRII